jgi:hypothetical protein
MCCSLSVIGNLTAFQWMLLELGPTEYFLRVPGESTIIKVTSQLTLIPRNLQDEVGFLICGSQLLQLFEEG